jgi:excisionase family DNA binding protein
VESKQESPVMTPKEVADLFKGRLGRNAVYEAIRRGDIPSTRIGDRIFVPRRKLMDILEGSSDVAGDGC